MTRRLIASNVTAGLKRLCCFIDCKFAGVKGQPAIEGSYVVERPNFSMEGDGTEPRTAAAVFALWGSPTS